MECAANKGVQDHQKETFNWQVHNPINKSINCRKVSWSKWSLTSHKF